jgi:hypothetical protein
LLIVYAYRPLTPAERYGHLLNLRR